jgi:modulator of FtsH protease
MNDPLRPNSPTPFGFDRGVQDASFYAGDAAARQNVLRNTYWLLSLSLIPTVFGAYVGLETGVFRSMGAYLVLFLLSMGLIFAIQRFKDSGTGVALLLGFTFIMGVLMSSVLAFTLHFANGAFLIALAFGGTALIFFTMATIATVSKRDFSAWGQWLFVGLIVVIIASVVNMFLQMPALMLALSVVSIVIFSGFMVFDIQRVVRGGETNYITATLSIYLDLINVFQNLLMILGIFGGSSRD